MIAATLNLAHRLDKAIRTAAGRPYHVVIGIGLVLEIIDRIHRLHDAEITTGSLFRSLVTMLFCLLLLLHQLGELSEHVDNRLGKNQPGRRRTSD